MPSTKKQESTTNSKPIRRKVILTVEPQNGSVKRLVKARIRDREFTDKLDVFKSEERDRWLKKLAKESGYEIDELAHAKQKLVQAANDADEKAKEEKEEKAEANEEERSDSSDALADTPEDILEEANEFLKSPNLFKRLTKDLELIGIAREVILAVTIYLVATSRKLQQPLSGCVKSASSSGKSHVTHTVLEFFPSEDVVTAADMTQSSLYYLPPGSLRHKVVFVAERRHVARGDEGGAANATLALREMISHGRIDKWVPVRSDNGFTTVHIEQEGPIAYMETTTQDQVFEEDATRLLSLTTDESPKQTQAILKRQALEAAGEGGSEEQRERIRSVHQTAQRMLKPLRVRIPYAPKLVIPWTKVVARRAFPQLLGCIRAVALLRQFQKAVVDGQIDADAEDYRVAYRLMLPILRRTFAPLSERAISLHQMLASNKKFTACAARFTRADCEKLAGVGTTEIRNRLNVLVDAGIVEQVSGKQGVKYEYRLLNKTPSQQGVSLDGLLTPKQLQAALQGEESGNSEDDDLDEAEHDDEQPDDHEDGDDTEFE
jgi:hypothetical protein